MLIVYSDSQEKEITLSSSLTLFPKESIELIEFGGFFVGLLTPLLSARDQLRINRVYLLFYLFAYFF
jgi:hypothetical protein